MCNTLHLRTDLLSLMQRYFLLYLYRHQYIIKFTQWIKQKGRYPAPFSFIYDESSTAVKTILILVLQLYRKANNERKCTDVGKRESSFLEFREQNLDAIPRTDSFIFNAHMDVWYHKL